MALLLPQGKQAYTDSAGDPLAGGLLYTYAAGTSTPLATYSDQAGATPNANPVVLDARGEATVFWSESSYKVVLHDSADAPIWTQDNVGPEAVTAAGASTARGLAAWLGAAKGWRSPAEWGDHTALTGAHLASAAAQAVTDGVGLLIAHPVTISTAIDLGTVPVRFEGRGRVVRSGSGTLTGTGPLTAPIGQIFEGWSAGLTFAWQVEHVVPQWWGAVGNWTGSTGADDTVPIQAACDAAAAALDPATYGAGSPAFGSPRVHFPAGYYRITSPVTVSGAVTVTGDPGTSFGGSRIVQVTDHVHLFVVGPANDGSSAAVEFRDLTLRQTAASITAGTSLVHIPATTTGANSIYFRNIWFQSPEDYAINAERGDDIQITDCTFDVSAARSIRLGSAGAAVTNAVISRNTFYKIGLGLVDVLNAERVVFAENRVYGNSTTQIPYAINATTTSPVTATEIVISANTFYYTNAIIKTTKSHAVVVGNTAKKATDTLIQFGGGGILYGNVVAGNSFWGAFGASAVIDATGTGIQASAITGNAFFGSDPSGTSTLGINLPDSRSQFNRVEANAFVSFTTDQTLYSNSVAPLVAAGDIYLGTGPRIIPGSGAPSADAPIGSVYLRTDGTGRPQLYSKRVAGSGAGNWVLSSALPVASADNGDANATLTVGSNAPIQRWATTLTANRTVTLSTTGAANGDAWRIVRTGLGAFTLDVGGLKTIPSATAAFVDVTYTGSAWILTGYGTL
jgi:hypothetical protein